MKKIYLPRMATILRTLISSLICLIAMTTIVRASSHTSNILQFTPPPPPAGDPPTGRLRGGASRGECPKVDTQLTALSSTIKDDRVWGLTTVDRPTFWFYIPYTKNTVNKAEFTIQDSQEDDVYRSAIALPTTTGILGITIPETVKPLEVDRDYTWYFKIYCSANSRSPLYVKGTIRRVDLPSKIASKLIDKTPQQKLETYAANGIWYDTLNLLAKMRLDNPKESQLMTEWIYLLENNGLGELKNIELIR
jgi:hypothetical protein